MSRSRAPAALRSGGHGPKGAAVAAGLAALALGLGAALAGTVSASGSAPAVATPADALPPTLNPNASFVVVQELVLMVPQGPAVRVDELVQGVNRSSSPVKGLVFALPPGAIGVSLQSGAAAGAFQLGQDGAHIAATVAPGASVAYGLTYTMSWDAGAMWLPVAYPTAQFTVLLPHGAWRLSGPGFAPAGSTRLGGNVEMDAFTTMAPTPGALLPLRVSPRPFYGRLPVRIGAAAAVLLAAAAGLRAVRRRRAGTARAEAELIDAVARLDLARTRGELPEEAYLERRRSLLEELEGLGGA